MKTITREEILAKKDELVLIDVREVYELKAYGKILDAINIPLSKLQETFSKSEEELKEEYNFDKQSQLVVYCRSGGRSAQAAAFLKALGYDVANYEGSILDWSQFDESVQAY